MFDIFNDTKEPELYIADVTIEFRVESKRKKPVYMTKEMSKYPVILLNGDFPTDRSRKSFIQKAMQSVASKPVPGTEKIKSISNVKFSSKLTYKFDFDRQ